MEAVQNFPRLPPEDPAKWPSIALSAGVHLLLIGALFLGVQWKSKPPSAVEVEVWRAAPAAMVASPPTPRPEPRPESTPVPKPEAKPESKPQPKPEPKPEPKPLPRSVAKQEPEPRAPVKPDIALKEEKKLRESVKEPAKEPKAKEPPRKEEAKPKEPPRKEEARPKEPPRKEEAKAKEPPKKDEPRKAEPERRPSFDEELKREQKQLQQQKAAQDQRARADAEARQLKQLQAEQAAAESARKKSLDDRAYKNAIAGKIRGNISLPPGIQGNPQAEFEVTQLPTGEVLDVKLRRSSGSPALDAAIERAIRKSSPLPKPSNPDLFERVLALSYRPRDD